MKMTISAFVVNVAGWAILGYLLFGWIGVLAGPLMTLISYLLFKKSRSAIEYPDKRYPPFGD